MPAYLLGHLVDVNRRMAIHVGDAKTRLSVEAANILLLPSDEVPTRFRSDFEQLKEIIRSAIKRNPIKGATPRLGRMTNETAARYIKLLIAIQDDLDSI